ncbi:helix-turn-helix domain-containing protein [Cupriavidus basilensis]|uniref:helix-turn-helix domain-containing protein n=1 Tax=Cupriavidus basilensis TaxID=68895 RepID=UPI00157AB784|nr:helix-turn-helix transcriptional regulator [Cupriavidus basilensis]NUA26915.1 helix-turn-helix transcriptional regulator [Cupriavidus basilensis]
MRQLITSTLQLGGVLHSARRAVHLSQAEVASRLGVGQSRMSNIELNPHTISADQLLTLCSILGLELVLQHRDYFGDQAPPCSR